MKFATINDLRSKINKAYNYCKVTKDNDVKLLLYNYIGNLYEIFNSIDSRKINFSKDKFLGCIDNYNWYLKKTGFLIDSFENNYIKNKEFHSDYFYGLLIETSDLFLDLISENDINYDIDDRLTKNEFITLLHDFGSSIGLENLFLDIVTSSDRIFKDNSNNIVLGQRGLSTYNPVTGVTNILINNFDYNIESMFTLVHEIGHVYDNNCLNNDRFINQSEKVNYLYCSLYSEVISTLFERLFINYLIKNNIFVDSSKNLLLEHMMNGQDYLLFSYILSLLEDDYLINDSFLDTDTDELVLNIKDSFENLDLVRALIENNTFDLSTVLNYTYGDIISLFLKDSVLEEGINSRELWEFMNIRVNDFNKDFIERSTYNSINYGNKYEKEIQLIKKL